MLKIFVRPVMGGLNPHQPPLNTLLGVSAPVEIHVLDNNVYGRTRAYTDVYVRLRACTRAV